MSGVTVEQFAEKVGIQLDTLLGQLKDAGIAVTGAGDAISEEDKQQLLAFLRKSHGEADQNEGPKKITLKRKSKTQLIQSTPNQRRAKSVNVEVRKKRTYVKRSSVPEDNEKLKEAEAAKKALEERAKSDEVERERKRQSETASRAVEKQDTPAANTADSEANVNTQSAESKDVAAAKKAPVESVSTVKSAPAQAIPSVDHKKKKQKTKTGEATDENKERRAREAKGKTRGKNRQKQFFAEDDDSERRKRKKKNKNRKEAASQHQFELPTEPKSKEIEVPEMIAVSDLAQRMSVKAVEVIKKLMSLGIMATIHQNIERDTAILVVEEFGHSAINEKEVDLEAMLVVERTGARAARPPVVTIMGHVDHGKTSLLDYIRESKVADKEAGGITQHIGAYHVESNNGMITFLDTPGHAAFTAMRSRGAEMTDIVILVVAADDGVMPQTKEAIQHAKAAKVPLIIAVNKMDKPDADPERVKQELSSYEVVPEEWGGENIFVNVSAKTGDGVDNLLDAIVLQAEMLELQADPTGVARGSVVESSLDKGRGPMATVLVQEGELKKGDILVCGDQYGRVRAMFDESGQSLLSAGPSMPVVILGLSGAPNAGDDLHVVYEEKKAREIAEFRREKVRTQKIGGSKPAKLEDIFANLEEDKQSALNVLIKADVQGSVEALKDSLIKLSNDEVVVKVLAAGVGGINESDVSLASASNGVMIAFNVRADASAKRLAAEKELDIRYYSVIYEAIDDVKNALSGLLEPEVREEIVGLAEVRDVFKSSKLGAIAGCMVVDGAIRRNLPIRVLRDNVVIYEGHLESLRRFKEDASEVKSGLECGIGVKNYNDVKSGDAIEVFERSIVARTI